MRAYLDCPGCSCLVAVGESACPFCGHAVRSAGAPSWLGLGLVLTLGAGTISCGDKGDETATEATVTASESASESESQSSQGPDSNGDVSDSSDFPDGATYAGPDETWTTDPGTTTQGPGSSSTTTPPDPTNAEGSTYAGPDETDSFGESASSTSTTTTTGSSSGTEGETLGSTGDTEGGSSGTGSSG